MFKQLNIKNDFSPLLRLAIPMVISGLVQSSLPFFENIFLAQLGVKVLAAGALVSWLFATLIVILFGTFGAVNILISHKWPSPFGSRIVK
jgi:MATE family multidrug resistance protein